MLSRLMLLLSCSVGVLFGLGFTAIGAYGIASSNLIDKLMDNIDLSALPKFQQIKEDIIASFKNSGFQKTLSSVFLSTGMIVTTMSGLGVLAAITGWKIIILVYVAVQILFLLTFALLMLLIFTDESVIQRTLTSQLADWQNTNFVSLVALMGNEAGSASFGTIVFNVMHVMLECCGIKTRGDARNSLSWLASERGVADLLKLSKDGSDDDSFSKPKGGNQRQRRATALDPKIPDWLKDRIPKGTKLPPGVNLPDKLPEGIEIPKHFNITDLSMMTNATAIRQFFEKSLTLLTPISCCRFKDKSLLYKFKAKELVSNLVDQQCPFSATNGVGVHSATCFRQIVSKVKGYWPVIFLAGVVMGTFMVCNIGLAMKIFFCG